MTQLICPQHKNNFPKTAKNHEWQENKDGLLPTLIKDFLADKKILHKPQHDGYLYCPDKHCVTFMLL